MTVPFPLVGHESKRFAIYGANPSGEIIFNAINDPANCIFIDDQGASDFLGKSVKDARSFLNSWGPGLETIVLAKRSVSIPLHGQVLDGLPLALLNKAATSRVLHLSLKLEFYGASIELSNLRTPGGFLVDLPKSPIEFLLALLSLIGRPLSDWRQLLRQTQNHPCRDGWTWRNTSSVFSKCGYSKAHYVLFRLGKRLEPNNKEIAQELIFANSGVMNTYAHLRHHSKSILWARRTYRLAMSFLKRWPECFTSHKLAAIAAQETQDFQEPISLLEQAQLQRSRSQNSTEFLHLSPALFTRIGSTMHVETLVKSQLLGWDQPKPLICVFHKESWGNSHLVNHYLSKYIQFIDEKDVCEEVAANLNQNDSWFELGMVQQGQFRFTPAATISARNEWKLRDLSPLFKLNDSDLNYGFEFLRAQGLDPYRRFVTVHSRHEPDNKTDFRNSSIMKMMPTISWLVEQGFSVIRLGDHTMLPMPSLSNTLDLATNFPYDPRLHVYFLAACAFYVGSSSGPITVPPSFGVSTVSVDTLPIGSACGTPQDTFLPNLVMNKKTGKLATWDLAWSLKASIAHFAHQWDKLHLELIGNSSEDILAAVQYHACKHGFVELKTQEYGSLPSNSITQRYRKLLDYPFTLISTPILCELSHPFMQKYSYLLPDQMK